MFFESQTRRKSPQRFSEIVPSVWCINCEGTVTDRWSSRGRYGQLHGRCRPTVVSRRHGQTDYWRLREYAKFRNTQRSAYTTSLPKVIWEEGRVAALSHTYAVKSPLVTMTRHKFAPKSTPSRGPSPNRTACLIPEPVRPTMANGIRIRSAVFPQCTGQTDARTHRPTHRPTHTPTDRPRESLTFIGHCATRATRLNNDDDDDNNNTNIYNAHIVKH